MMGSKLQRGGWGKGASGDGLSQNTRMPFLNKISSLLKMNKGVGFLTSEGGGGGEGFGAVAVGSRCWVASRAGACY